MRVASPTCTAASFARLSAALAIASCLACATTTETTEGDAVPTDPPAPEVSVSASAGLVGVDDSVEPDPEVAAWLAPRAEAVRARANRVVGKLSGPLTRGKPESPMGSWASDAMRDGMARHTGQPMDICFTNTGGLRRDLDAGEITEGMLVEVMPFDNAVVVFSATPEVTQKILDRLAERGDPVSGITYKRTEEGARDVQVNGEPIGDKKSYRLCTNDYVFAGGGGYPFDDVTDISNTGVLLRDVFIQEFERLQAEGGAVEPPPAGRVSE